MSIYMHANFCSFKTYIFIVFLGIYCGKYFSTISNMSSSILIYREILHLPHSTCPLISSVYLPMGHRKKEGGKKSVLIYYPVCLVMHNLLRSRLCAVYQRSSDEKNKKHAHSSEEEPQTQVTAVPVPCPKEKHSQKSENQSKQVCSCV